MTNRGPLGGQELDRRFSSYCSVRVAWISVTFLDFAFVFYGKEPPPTIRESYSQSDWQDEIEITVAMPTVWEESAIKLLKLSRLPCKSPLGARGMREVLPALGARFFAVNGSSGWEIH